MSDFTDADVPDQRGKCFVVTGANTGLGFEAAKVLASRGARVLLACRSEAKAGQAIDRILDASPAADVEFVPLDQADLDSVRACAERVKSEPRVDVLVNNAGVMVPPLQRTAQGHELQFGVNHLGCFALTGLLLDKLAETPGARVVVTSSLAHRRGRIDWDDLDAHRSYSRGQRYSDSKLMNLLFAVELDRRLQAAGVPVTAVACHPGIAATDLARHLPSIARGAWPLFGLILNTAAKGAWPTLQAATDPAVVPGGYYGPQRLGGAAGKSGLAPIAAVAQDREAARRLWELSIALTGVDPGLPPA